MSKMSGFLSASAEEVTSLARSVFASPSSSSGFSGFSAAPFGSSFFLLRIVSVFSTP